MHTDGADRLAGDRIAREVYIITKKIRRSKAAHNIRAECQNSTAGAVAAPS